MEAGSVQDILTSASHPYTRIFLAAAREEALPELQSSDNNTTGCIYRDNCRRAQELCAAKNPELIPVGREHLVACHFVNVVKNR